MDDRNIYKMVKYYIFQRTNYSFNIYLITILVQSLKAEEIINLSPIPDRGGENSGRLVLYPF